VFGNASSREFLISTLHTIARVNKSHPATEPSASKYGRGLPVTPTESPHRGIDKDVVPSDLDYDAPLCAAAVVGITTAPAIWAWASNFSIDLRNAGSTSIRPWMIWQACTQVEWSRLKCAATVGKEAPVRRQRNIATWRANATR
jgi:hypothetical protein